VREIMLREKPDLIYERISYMSTAVSEVANELGITHFSEFNAPYPQERVKLEGWSLTLFLARRAERKQLALTTKAFTVSSILKKHLAKVSGVDAQKIVVTPNAVNPEKFKPSEEKQSQLRAKWNLDSAAQIVGFVGSIFPYHGVDLLIDAFLLEKEKNANSLKLMVVGDGETLPSLRERIQGNRFQSDIVFTGNVPYAEVADYLALMDIAVMARSDWYMSPVKIFEYGLMKKAIVAQNTSPINDVMEHKVHGWVADSSVKGLHEGISFLLHHPAEARAMAEAFHAKVLRMHTWDEVGKQILKESK
jgi:glycosyltransferase involved in cell wall biosynthesis